MAKRGRPLGCIVQDSLLRDFISFIVKRISKAKGRNRNPVMARLLEEFCDKYNIKWNTARDYSTHVRVILEREGYILYASINSVDRRIRYLAPTPKFPLSHHHRKLEMLISMVHTNFSAEACRVSHRTLKGEK